MKKSVNFSCQLAHESGPKYSAKRDQDKRSHGVICLNSLNLHKVAKLKLNRAEHAYIQ
jgi:hypothetical protein